MANSGKSKNDRRSLDDVKRENSMMDKKLREKESSLISMKTVIILNTTNFSDTLWNAKVSILPQERLNPFFLLDTSSEGGEMSPRESKENLRDPTILEDNRVDVSLTENLPDNLIYNFIGENVIPAEVAVSPLSAGFEIFDGCGGD